MQTKRTNPILIDSVLTKRPDECGNAIFRNESAPTKQDRKLAFRRQCAKDFVGTLEPGAAVFGLSKGQFSRIDLLSALAEQMGPSVLTLSTWTAAGADLAALETMIADRVFLSVRFLVDFSFQRRQPALIHRIRQTYGPDSIVVTSNHAKFVLMDNARLKIVVRTSMNLNFNPRLEDVDIKEDPELFRFLDNVVGEFFNRHDAKAQAKKTTAELSEEFRKLTV